MRWGRIVSIDANEDSQLVAAGLLTAIATEGFTALTEALRTVSASRPADPLAALGRAYIDFGLTHRALFDLMFRPTEEAAEIARGLTGLFAARLGTGPAPRP